MPNQCANRWYITGPKVTRNFLVEILKNDTNLLDFNNIKKAPNDADKEWYLNNWGTKWNCESIDLNHSESSTIYTFLTAWSPPDETMIREFMSAFQDLEYELLFAERNTGCYGKFGHHYPKFTKSFDSQSFMPVSFSEVFDENIQKTLIPSLFEFQELYDKSG